MRLLRLHCPTRSCISTPAPRTGYAVRARSVASPQEGRRSVRAGRLRVGTRPISTAQAANVAYGLAVSKYLGGAHFVVNTDANAHRPSPAWRARMGGCPPPNVGVGIGPEPCIRAIRWWTPSCGLDTPGYASGHCIHQGAGFAFDPKLALTMERNAGPPF